MSDRVLKLPRENVCYTVLCAVFVRSGAISEARCPITTARFGVGHTLTTHVSSPQLLGS